MTVGAELTGEALPYERLAPLLERAREESLRHQEVMQALYAELTALQQSCPHEHTRYSPDPCGGYDSFTSCLDCGAEKSRGRWKVALDVIGGRP